MKTEDIFNIIKKDNRKAGLISILEEIQAKFTYLPEEALRLVAKEKGYSLVDIYGVATFYKAFSLKPRGRHCLSACVGTACHVRGSHRIIEEYERQLDISPGQTTPDNEITLETVNCLGACALGPIVVLDKHYFANVTPGKAQDIIDSAKNGTNGSNGNSNGHAFSLEASCPQCNRSLMDKKNYLDGYPSIRINASVEGKVGWARLPSIYGNFTPAYQYKTPENTVVDFKCPHCGSSLRSTLSCLECNAPMAKMSVYGGGGVINVCTRAGCNGHMLDLGGTGF